MSSMTSSILSKASKNLSVSGDPFSIIPLAVLLTLRMFLQVCLFTANFLNGSCKRSVFIITLRALIYRIHYYKGHD